MAVPALCCWVALSMYMDIHMCTESQHRFDFWQTCAERPGRLATMYGRVRAGDCRDHAKLASEEGTTTCAGLRWEIRGGVPAVFSEQNCAWGMCIRSLAT